MKPIPIKTVRKSRSAGRPRRCFLPLFPACLALCLAATSCRTYLGSDDLHKQETGGWRTIEQESGLEKKNGVILSIRGDASLQFRFLTRSYDKKVMEQNVYEYGGKRYYYFDNVTPWNNPLVVLVLTPVLMPFDALFSLLDYDYHYRGENRPGLFYQIAYLPLIRHFFQPVLLSPGSFTFSFFLRDKTGIKDYNKLHEYMDSNVSTEDVYDDRTLTKVYHREVYAPKSAADDSNATVKITAGDKKLSRKVSSNGTLDLDLPDIGSAAFGRQGSVKFMVRHEKWKMDWEIEMPATLDPEVICDWNIFVDEQYDYRNRVLALSRLKPVLGETACRDYFNMLLDGKADKMTLSPMPTAITVSQR